MKAIYGPIFVEQLTNRIGNSRLRSRKGGRVLPQPHAGPLAPRKPLGKHLTSSLSKLWKSYGKMLKRVHRHASETGVHALRVQTRRLLSHLELLSAFVKDESLLQCRAILKKQLDKFDDLRDTQVHLAYISRELKSFPELKKFYRQLKRRERRLIKPTARRVAKYKARRLPRCVCAVQNAVEASFAGRRNRPTLEPATRVLGKTFEEVVQCRRQINPQDTLTIHRTRIAFKHFRYMAQSLQPFLPGITGRRLEQMHSYQTMMGEIQDVAMLTARLEKLLRKRKLAKKQMRLFYEELLRRQEALIANYLKHADELYAFWPAHT